MDRFTAMQVFVQIAQRGSLTDAGHALDMSRAMVSRNLESLEEWLGVRLLHRTTRRVSLTEAGAEALLRCRQVLELTGEVLAVAGARQAAPTGRLRIATNASFAQACLAELVTGFLGLYPEVEIELLVHDRTVNLVEERIDLAVRIGNQLDESLVARRLGVCNSVLCASPAYLAAAGMPASPDALGAHRCITHAYVGRNELRLKNAGQRVTVPFHGVLQTNDTTVARQATLRDAGIALLPTYLVSEDLLEGRLVRVLPAHEPEALGIHAVYLSRQHQPQLLRLMLDHLAGYFSDDMAPWDRRLVPPATGP
ncbi:MAG: LysR family transcriptional regulator [Comamonadaceae bacterium]|nr:MAG: LysR family transcriptional regulator [Comamonadaceae bacterium]